MKFTKLAGSYIAMRKDGKEITISKAEEGIEWVSRYSDDFNGDNTCYFKTLKGAKEAEQHIEEGI